MRNNKEIARIIKLSVLATNDSLFLSLKFKANEQKITHGNGGWR